MQSSKWQRALIIVSLIFAGEAIFTLPYHVTRFFDRLSSRSLSSAPPSSACTKRSMVSSRWPPTFSVDLWQTASNLANYCRVAVGHGPRRALSGHFPGRHGRYAGVGFLRAH